MSYFINNIVALVKCNFWYVNLKNSVESKFLKIRTIYVKYANFQTLLSTHFFQKGIKSFRFMDCYIIVQTIKQSIYVCLEIHIIITEAQ